MTEEELLSNGNDPVTICKPRVTYAKEKWRNEVGNYRSQNKAQKMC